MRVGEARQNPDTLLKRVQLTEEAQKKNQGKLKIFFGYAAGVGKTYTMLKAAHAAAEDGHDVVCGYIEPHARPATMALVDGLECLPFMEITHNGTTLHEFDLNAALVRHPEIILVDELAHTNASGSRHKKRYQDIEELLRAGIDVYTTINVQHLEGLNDKVAGITHVVVNERVPDHIFDYATSVELVDIEPDDLIDRLNQGKIYQPHMAKAALSNFFSKKNLAALREIALRRSADRLTRNPFAAGIGDSASGIESGDDVMVYVTGDKGNARVIRAAVNMAQAYKSNVIALVVKSSSDERKSDTEHDMLEENIKLAESLGAHTVVLYGDDAARQIAQYVPLSGVTRVVVGSSSNKWRFFNFGESLVNRLIQLTRDATVLVVPDKDIPALFNRTLSKSFLRFSWADALYALIAVGAATFIGMGLSFVNLSVSVILMVYLVSILLLAFRANSVFYGIISALLGVLAFNFFFVEPLYSFAAYGASYPLIFLSLVISAFSVSSITIRMNRQGEAAARRAYKTEVLLESDRIFQKARTFEECVETAARQTLKFLNRPVVSYLHDPSGLSKGSLHEPHVFDIPRTGEFPSEHYELISPSERAVADWVFTNGERAGAGTDTLSNSFCFYLPIKGESASYGVLGIALSNDDENELGPFEKNLLFALVESAGRAADHIAYVHERQTIELKAKTESLRSNLLRSISHDLRTPLTSISGNADVLLSSSLKIDQDTKQRLYLDIYNDAVWLQSLVENILLITRADSGQLNITLQPELVSEVVEEALRHVNRKIKDYNVDINISDSLLMAQMDVRLILQVIVNLINNAIDHTPRGSCIKIIGKPQGEETYIGISDNGPGLKPGQENQVFEMFYNGVASGAGDRRRGMGIGLALCKSIVEEHGGTIGVDPVHPHGCLFWFTLPRVTQDKLGIQNCATE